MNESLESKLDEFLLDWKLWNKIKELSSTSNLESKSEIRS